MSGGQFTNNPKPKSPQQIVAEMAYVLESMKAPNIQGSRFNWIISPEFRARIDAEGWEAVFGESK